MAQAACSCGRLGASVDLAEQARPSIAARLHVATVRPRRMAVDKPQGCMRKAQAWRTGPLPKRRCCVLVRAAEQSAATDKKELPIFPLNTVAFPTAPVPLHIFEARLEEGLIQYDKPFCGSRQFGMCWMNSDGGLAAIGTLLRIERHARLPDGRLAVDNMGVQRFRVLRVLEQAPVLMCEVEMLPDEDDSDPEVQALAAEVAGAFRDLLRLNHRMGRIQASEDSLVLGELEAMRPRDLSFWIGSVFADNSKHQQSLLQEPSTLERLKQEQHVLAGTVSYLRAKLALEGAFSSDSDSTGGDGGAAEAA